MSVLKVLDKPKAIIAMKGGAQVGAPERRRNLVQFQCFFADLEEHSRLVREVRELGKGQVEAAKLRYIF